MQGGHKQQAHIVAAVKPLVAEILSSCDGGLVHKAGRVHLQAVLLLNYQAMGAYESNTATAYGHWSR